MTTTANSPTETSRTMTRRDCVLAYIEARPGSDDAEIADALLLEPFEVSLIVRELRREGLIETDS